MTNKQKHYKLIKEKELNSESILKQISEKEAELEIVNNYISNNYISKEKFSELKNFEKTSEQINLEIIKLNKKLVNSSQSIEDITKKINSGHLHSTKIAELFVDKLLLESKILQYEYLIEEKRRDLEAINESIREEKDRESEYNNNILILEEKCIEKDRLEKEINRLNKEYKFISDDLEAFKFIVNETNIKEQPLSEIVEINNDILVVPATGFKPPKVTYSLLKGHLKIDKNILKKLKILNRYEDNKFFIEIVFKDKSSKEIGIPVSINNFTGPEYITGMSPENYISNDNLDFNLKNLIKGKDELSKKTVFFSFDDKGKVFVSNESVEIVQHATPTIIEIGTKPQIETKFLDFSISYKIAEDSSKKAGEEIVSMRKPGQQGRVSNKITFAVDPKTGVVKETGSTIVEETHKKDEVRFINTLEVIEEHMPLYTEYIGDDTSSLPAGSIVSETKGVAGYKKYKVKYNQIDSNGHIIESSKKITKLEEIKPEKRVVTISTRPSAIEKNTSSSMEVIYSPSEYLEDIPNGSMILKQAGAKGKTYTSITYEVNPRNGILKKIHGDEIKIKQAKPRIYEVYTKPEYYMTEEKHNGDLFLLKWKKTPKIDPNTGKLTGEYNEKLLSKYNKKSLAYLSSNICAVPVEVFVDNDKISEPSFEDLKKSIIDLDYELVSNYELINEESTEANKFIRVYFIDGSSLDVNVPVFIRPVTETKTVKFNTIHKADNSRPYDGSVHIEHKGVNGEIEEIYQFVPNSKGKFEKHLLDSNIVRPDEDEVILHYTGDTETEKLVMPDVPVKFILDNSLPPFTQIVESELEMAKSIECTTYTINQISGLVEENSKSTKIVEGKPKIVRFSDLPIIEEEILENKSIIYKEDPNSHLEPGKYQVEKSGSDGKIVRTKQYKLVSEDSIDLVSFDSKKTVNMEPEIRLVSTTPFSEKIEEYPFETEYIEDKNSNSTAGEGIVISEGSNGYKLKTTTFRADADGNISKTETISYVPPIKRVISVSMSSSREKVESIPYKTIYTGIEDNSVKPGKILAVEKGQDGWVENILNFQLEKSGKLINKISQETTPPVNEVVKVAVSKKWEILENIPFKTVFVADPESLHPAGFKETSQIGIPGAKRKVSTYSVNKDTGELTPETYIDTVDAVDEIIKVSTSSKIELISENAFDVVYKVNPLSEKTAGEIINYTAGKNGEVKKIIKYTLNNDGSISSSSVKTIATKPKSSSIELSSKPITNIEEIKIDNVSFTKEVSTKYELTSNGKLIPLTTTIITPVTGRGYSHTTSTEIEEIITPPTRYIADVYSKDIAGTQTILDYGTPGYTTKIITFKTNLQNNEIFDYSVEKLVTIPSEKVVKVSTKPTETEEIEKVGETEIQTTKITKFILNDVTGVVEISNEELKRKPRREQ